MHRISNLITKRENQFWLGLVDMMSSILIVFLMVTYVNDILNRENIEQIIVDSRRKAFISGFNNVFTKEKQQRKVAYSEDFDFLKIVFGSEILFNSGNYQLNNNGKKVINRCAQLIRDYEVQNARSIKEIQIQGHTDKQPLNKASYPRNNWELSTARALEVVTSLASNGIDKSLLSASGYESNRPLNNNKLSRRIELKIFFSKKIEK